MSKAQKVIPEKSYTVAQLLKYKNSECAETKKFFSKVKLFKNPPLRQQRKRSSQPTEGKKYIYDIEFLTSFKNAPHCQNPPNRARIPSSLKLKKPTKQGKKPTNKTFDVKMDSLDTFAYPEEGKKMLEKAGLDTTGLSNAELFIYEKQLMQTGSITIKKKEVAESPPLSPSLQPERFPSPSRSESPELEDDISSILTADDLFVPKKQSTISPETDSDSSWTSMLFASDNASRSPSIGNSFSSDRIQSPPRRSILSALQSMEEPKPAPQPEQDSLLDKETINKGTEIGTKLLDLLKYEMETKPTRVSPQPMSPPTNGILPPNSMHPMYHSANYPMASQGYPQQMGHPHQGHPQAMGNYSGPQRSFHPYSQGPMPARNTSSAPPMNMQQRPFVPPQGYPQNMNARPQMPPQGYPQSNMQYPQNGRPPMRMPNMYQNGMSPQQRQPPQQQQYYNGQNSQNFQYPGGQPIQKNMYPNQPYTIVPNQTQGNRIEIDNIFAQS